jgi:hypothetical protein
VSAVDDRLLMAAAEMIDDLGDVALRERRIFEQAWAAGYRVGYEAGHDVGHRRAHAEIAEDWRHLAEKIRGEARYVGLEERRWGPGGRAHFGDPRPTDWPGRQERGVA